eukprot:TRINITY_DN3259_c0_g1_i1.p1 TRINITY_DN3259_c0_g1~~TRINITY_DN3259_c0_g1_i1.p1  ORF type:complete len:375 (-),score=73.58 TRINITY_DN3259_c0_g1_i1:809-1933(-)
MLRTTKILRRRYKPVSSFPCTHPVRLPNMFNMLQLRGYENNNPVPIVDAAKDQGRQILMEMVKRKLHGTDTLEGEFWPGRNVDIDAEFPSQSPDNVQILQKPKKKFGRNAIRIPESTDIAVGSLDVNEKVTSSSYVNNFQDMGLDEKLLNIIREEWNITEPTNIQEIAIPQILASKDVFIAAQTGTGKTLSYVLPLLQKLLINEKNATSFRRRGQRSRAIILVPTRELVAQTVGVIRTCCKAEPFSHFEVLGIAGGIEKYKSETNKLTNGLDIIVATPDRLFGHINDKHFYLDDTNVMILDEADTLFSNPHSKEFVTLIVDKVKEEKEASKFKKAEENIQIGFVSATVSKAVADRIAADFPVCITIPFLCNVHY